jgi:hypothetical protein
MKKTGKPVLAIELRFTAPGSAGFAIATPSVAAIEV